jgi:hypothetical protein
MSSTRLQRTKGLKSVWSPGSSTAGKFTPAVRAPFDDENSVDTGTVGAAGRTRIMRAVSRIARSVLACSLFVAAALADGRLAAPPYT